MKNINLATNKNLGKGYKMDRAASEGVFKTARGFYIFKVKQGTKFSTSLPYESLEEAMIEFNNAKTK